jgi:S1-C subfamily serine protease
MRILRNFLSVFSILLITSCATTAAINCQNCAPTEQKSLPRASFVQVYSTIHTQHDAAIGSGAGSGVIVKHKKQRSFILTAGHICAKHKNINPETQSFRIFVKDIDNSVYEATVEDLNDIIDACIISTKQIDKNHVQLSNFPPKIGDTVFNLAAPYGIFNYNVFPIFRGIYSGVLPVDNKRHALYTIPSAPGSSGSPIFNSDGYLIGMIFAGTSRIENLALSVTYEQLRYYLSEVFGSDLFSIS